MPSRPLEESSELEDDGSKASGMHESSDGRDVEDRGHGPKAIRSSWLGDKKASKSRKTAPGMADVDEDKHARTMSGSSSRDQMYEVGLESQHLDDSSPPDDLAIEIPEDEDPPSVQRFKKLPREPPSPFIAPETDFEAQQSHSGPLESETSAAPPGLDDPEPTRHDVFWGHLYLISVISMFATFILIYLHTVVPTKQPLGDTIYSAIHSSFYLLAVDTVVAVVVSLVWLTLLRNYVRPLIYLILVAVPVILTAFTLYPFVSSFQHTRGQAGSIQDRAMRWLSTLPGFMAVLWLYGVWKARHAFSKAIGILEFACKILAANPPLLMLGFGTLAAVVTWTWIWMAMFSRVFLSGHLGGKYFIIDVSAWWLGSFFVFIYLWTLNIGSGLQRATTAATVSQWYFHRLDVPQPTSGQVASAALNHAGTTVFGTVCLSTLLTLLIKLPVLIMPGRLMACASILSYKLLPNSVLAMTHSATLTYAAIHSQSLTSSANIVPTLAFMNSANRFQSRNRTTFTRSSSVQPYNLATILLQSTRLIAAVAFGFGAWVSTARKLQIQSTPTLRGSLYAYIVGMIAGAIGYGILGAMEGVLTGIVDAVVVCWASEMRGGEVRYCREAGYLLGDGTSTGEDEEEGLMRR